MRQRAWTQQQRPFSGRSGKNIVPEPRSQRLNVTQPVLKTQYCCLKRYQPAIAFRYLSRVVGFHGDNQNLGSRQLGGPFRTGTRTLLTVPSSSRRLTPFFWIVRTIDRFRCVSITSCPAKLNLAPNRLPMAPAPTMAKRKFLRTSSGANPSSLVPCRPF